MAFVKAHGLEMAAGGYVKNMVIETFTTATEPTPTEQGRTWYNSDSDRWIMSVDNGSGSIIKRTFANLEELEAHAALVISTTEGEGANNVGYEGSGVQTNGLFALSAGLLDDVLDTITGNIDAEMKIADDLETNKLSRDGTQAMTANLDMDGNKLVNLASGTDAGDAVTKAQLDAVQSGLDTKESCRAATTTNLSATYDNAAGTLTASANGHLEMDNVRLDVGNRVLVMDQTNGYENGIYDVTVAGSAGAAAEVTDVTMVADTAGDMSGRYFLVNDPTTEYFVWLDTGASTSPDAAGKPLEGLGKTGIQVVITANDDAATIAGLVQVAVNNATDFDASVLSSVVTISNVNDGNVTAAANAENDAYDIGSTINVTTQGDEAAAVFVLTRSADADNLPGAEVTSGMFTFIEEGTSAGDNGFQLVTNEVVTLGVTDLNMVQFTGAGQVIADHGLRKSGNEMDVFIADFIDTAEGLKSDGAGSGFSSKIQWDATTAKWTGQAGTNGEFTIASTNMDNAMDSIVDEIDSYKSEIRSQTAAEGSSNVGYDGQTTTHTLFTLAASQVDAALDSVADGLDAEMKSTDEHIASLVSQTATEGSAIVGYDGQAGANALFNLAASQVDTALDSLTSGLDTEMKATDDHIASLLSQSDAEGAALVGYDGVTPGNSLFSLAAGQVDATLDALAVGIDSEMKSTDDYIALVASQTAAEGSSNVGYDGVTTANSLFNLAAAQVDATLDSLATGLDAEMKNQDDYEALLLSQTAAEGSSKVGYDGITTSNSLFNLAAAQVDASLDSLATGLDAEMKATDDYIALLASTTEGEGANNVGFEGYAGTNTEFSVAASSLDSVLDTIIQAIDDDRASEGGTSGAATLGYEGETGANGLYTIAGPTNVGAALDGIVQAVDTDRKVLDDYQADVLSQTAAEGSALVGYDGNTPSNSLFSLAAAQVDATLDSLATGLDAEMKATDDYIALLASQTDGEGAANVGYDGANGANALFSLAAGQVDASLNALVTGLDAEMKNQDDYEALLLSQTAAEGSSKVGYDGAVGTNTQFSLAASQVDAALDSLMQGVDTEMQTRSDADDAIVTNFNALSTVGTSAAAYTHTIAHTYGQDILPQIWVDQSGNWVFDIVAITNNNNSLVVELTEQKQIKYAIFSMGDISKS
jgi:hypothetical protein